MKHWNLGNTTVRNPDRIREALLVFKRNFEGKKFSEDQQLKYFNKLLSSGIIESDSVSNRTKEISGRKWAACFNQLGLAKAWKSKGNIEITDAGNALIDPQIIEEDIFLRQFLKYKLPSEIEKGSLYEGFDVNPFFVILKLLFDLEKEGLRGLSKDEIGLYVITCIRNELIEESKKKIILYRRGYSKIKGRVKKREYYYDKKRDLIKNLYHEEISEKNRILDEVFSLIKDNSKVDINDRISLIIAAGKGSRTKKSLELGKRLKELLKEGNLQASYDLVLDFFMETKGRTLNDYADTTVRYTTKTGLFSISGDKLILREDKKLLVQNLLVEFQNNLGCQIFEDFYSSRKPHLPIDDLDFLRNNLQSLYKRKLELQKVVGQKEELKFGVSNETNSNKLRKIQKDLELEIKNLKEIIFYRNQSKKEVIEEILSYYDQILDRTLLGGEAYRPAYLEWTTWRLFLAINNLSNKIPETRNFEIDEELNPIHNAKGGVPDMIFEYEDFLVVCEVTLLTSEKQWAEDEPVQRHVANAIKNTNKKVYGLFIAPNIDPNTIYEYHRKKRLINGQEFDLNIVSLTIDQIKKLLVKFERSRFKTKDFGKLLEDLSNLQYSTEKPLEWQKMVNKNYEKWVA